MNRDYRHEIIIWFDTPPKVSKGSFNYLSKKWGPEVYFICNKDFPAYRKNVNWNDGNFGDANVIHLDRVENKLTFIQSVFDRHPEALHIISGFNTGIERLVRPFILSAPNHLVFFSERPVEVGFFFERIARLLYFKFKYRYYYNLYKNRVDVLLPLGMKGVETFVKYGWPYNKLRPFMYNPEGGLIEEEYLKSKGRTGTIRFLYVGRFYYRTKGVDVLMRAVKYLIGSWSLDFVGGYGKKAEEVKAWIEHTPHVHYLGSWPSEEVSHRISEYDVVVVPSKYDGWNLLVNEAINAGVGVIASDQAVSDEVIRFGHAGDVFKSERPKELAKIMQRVIDNPNLADEWHNNAIISSHYISPESVGDYLISVLDYFVYGKGVFPVCPWLTKQ